MRYAGAGRRSVARRVAPCSYVCYSQRIGVIQYNEAGHVATTATGARCGNCANHHASADAVRMCYQITRTEDAMAEAESRAEQAAERYLEDRGYDEARAQEGYEERHGVIGFAEAYRAACPWLFGEEGFSC